MEPMIWSDSPENQQTRDVLRITPGRVAACVRDLGR